LWGRVFSRDVFLPRQQRRNRRRRRRIPPRRLEHDRLRLYVDTAQLLGDERAVRFIAHDDGRRGRGHGTRAQHRLLEQRPLGDQR
jgi:hypothetical protein